MERASKRPRLSMFADMQPDDELERARQHNDLLLKNKFEAIFDKYARDFSGVGDVVDLNTGQVIEDNGHLRKMDNEKDAGQPRSRPSKSEPTASASGQSLLRAMTVAPDRDDSYFSDAGAQDVIQSIETIAENAALSDDGDTESLDQGDDLPGTDGLGQSTQQFAEQDTPFTSDTDSLFEVVDSVRQDGDADNRESSPDSLFGGETQHKDPRGGGDESTPLQDFTETAIFARFGPRVGKKVVDLIEKRDKAELHIDPAWRIPVHVQPRQSTSTRSRSTISHTGSSLSQSRPISPFPVKQKSMWGEGTRRKGSLFAPRAGALCFDREESEDPLQDGFYSGQSDTDDEADLARCDKAARQGVCPFCLEQYVDRCAVLQHLNRELKYCQRGEDRGQHDLDHLESLMDYIHKKAKQKSSSNIGNPRLPVCDFKTMVELHEGASMSFKEIIDADVLWTMKNDPDLLAFLYFGWRDIEDVMGMDGTPSKEWTKKENKVIRRLLKSAKMGMTTLKRNLKKRTAVEIGNKLADMWLTDLNASKKLPVEDDSDEEEEEDEDEDEEAEYEEESEEAEQQSANTTASKHGRRKTWSPSFSEDETDPEYRPGQEERRRPKRKPRKIVDSDVPPERPVHSVEDKGLPEPTPTLTTGQTHAVQPMPEPTTQDTASLEDELS